MLTKVPPGWIPIRSTKKKRKEITRVYSHTGRYARLNLGTVVL